MSEDLITRFPHAPNCLVNWPKGEGYNSIVEVCTCHVSALAEKDRFIEQALQRVERLTANIEANYREIQDCLMATGDEGEAKSVADAVKSLRADHDRLEADNERLRQALTKIEHSTANIIGASLIMIIHSLAAEALEPK